MPDVVLPVLDEAEAIPWVLHRMPDGYSPVVVDNGSSDGSAEIAARLGALVVREDRRGFGAACWTGLQAARDGVVCFMDCDGSLDPQSLPSVVGPLLSGEADLVIGARVASGRAWPIHARLGNRYLAATVRRRTGVRLRDIGPMRAARRRDLLTLGLLDRRSGWPLEMVLAAARRGWRIAEVPVPYRARAGQSKVTGTILGTMQAIRDMSRVLA
jgi:glycosyltransferase involved in cell wall biosynthesis